MTTKPAKPKRKPCPRTRADGQPCRALCNPGSDACIGHTDTPAAQEARRRGGRHTAKPIRAMKLMPAAVGPLADRLQRAIIAVHEGTLAPQRLAAMATAMATWTKLLGVGLLEERIRELEAETKRGTKR